MTPRPLTYEEFHPIATAPLRLTPTHTLMPNRTYGGKIWSGVQVADTFYGTDINVGILPARLVKSREYDGVYKDSVNISPADAVALFGDTE